MHEIISIVTSVISIVTS